VAAQSDGLLDLDEPVSKTITEWQSDPVKASVTIRQLLSLTAGLEAKDGRGQVPTYAEALLTPFVSDPGEKFAYSPAPFQVFGEVMRRKLSDSGRSPLDYLSARVFDPIGLEYGDWKMGEDGNPHLPSGAKLTASNWALYGELVRLNGEWEGEQILPADLLNECFIGTLANPAYGLTWWMNRPVDPNLRATIPQLTTASDDMTGIASIPSDLVFAAGAGKQRLYISRSMGLVVVRQASGIVTSLFGVGSSDFSDVEFLNLLLTGQPVR